MAQGIRVNIDADEAVGALNKLKDAVRSVKSTRLGSDLPYAYGIEYGRHRGGRLARRAGGAYYLHAGAEQITGEAPKLARALGKGPAATKAEYQEILERGLDVARRRTPVRTGRLSRSLRIYIGKGI